MRIHGHSGRICLQHSAVIGCARCARRGTIGLVQRRERSMTPPFLFAVLFWSTLVCYFRGWRGLYRCGTHVRVVTDVYAFPCVFVFPPPPTKYVCGKHQRIRLCEHSTRVIHIHPYTHHTYIHISVHLHTQTQVCTHQDIRTQKTLYTTHRNITEIYTTQYMFKHRI